jgi:hypothetical protein
MPAKPAIPNLIMTKLQKRYGTELSIGPEIDRRIKTSSAWQGTEHDLQKAYFARIAEIIVMSDLPELYLAHAIPNGDIRDPRAGARLKAEGVKSGIPDVFIPIVESADFNDPKSGLYIEFKKAGGSPSEHQRAMLLMLQDQNFRVIVCNDLDTAVYVTKKHLGLV